MPPVGHSPRPVMMFLSQTSSQSHSLIQTLEMPYLLWCYLLSQATVLTPPPHVQSYLGNTAGSVHSFQPSYPCLTLAQSILQLLLLLQCIRVSPDMTGSRVFVTPGAHVWKSQACAGWFFWVMKLQCGNSVQGQSVTLTGGWVLGGDPREMRLAGALAELQVTETGLLRLQMYQLAILFSPRTEDIYLQWGKSTQRTDEIMNSLTWLFWNFTTEFWHLSKMQEQDPKCPIIPMCLRPRLKIPQRFFVSCVAQQSWPTAPLWMAIHREKAWTVFSCRMAILALPAEAPAKVLLLAFCCQPELPSGLSQTADISSLVSMSFVHQSSSQCCFMMCCKTTMLPWVCSAWLPHLSLLSLHTGPSSITASSELRVRTWSAVLPQPGVVWTLISRSLCPQLFFFFQEMWLLLIFGSQPRLQNRKPNFKIQLTVPNGGDFNV